jgi:Ca2+-binding EF-hand superfamily protein
MWRIFLMIMVVLPLSACGESARSIAANDGDVLRRLGARGRAGLSPSQIEAYAATFGFLDTNGNGLISQEEYEENSIFPNPSAARGVFGATDRDGSGGVTVDEYVDNRIITDEAKVIHQEIDQDESGGVTRAELESRTSWAPSELDVVFAQFDRDGDGAIVQIEWLLTWGNWARLPGAGLV